MFMNALLAALCLVPLAASMYIGGDFGYDPPDQKIFRRNAFGQIQAFDVSTESRLVPNAYGGLSHYNVMEISDPDLYTNTVGNFGGMGAGLAGGMAGSLGGGMGGGMGRRFGSPHASRYPSPFSFLNTFPYSG